MSGADTGTDTWDASRYDIGMVYCQEEEDSE